MFFILMVRNGLDPVSRPEVSTVVHSRRRADSRFTSPCQARRKMPKPHVFRGLLPFSAVFSAQPRPKPVSPRHLLSGKGVGMGGIEFVAAPPDTRSATGAGARLFTRRGRGWRTIAGYPVCTASIRHRPNRKLSAASPACCQKNMPAIRGGRPCGRGKASASTFP